MQTSLFDTPICRKGSDCYKWDAEPPVKPDEQCNEIIPLWVADMDFAVAPCITEALQKRLEHPVFGYVKVPERYYDSVIGWFARRHAWTIKRKHILYTIGVVPAVNAILKALTEKGDKVIMQTPAYNCFFTCIENNGLQLLQNPLVSKDNYYTIDFDDLEQKAKDPKAKVLLLCNPHNPTGRVWRPEELRLLADIARRHNLCVISDEIHCEFTITGIPYTPMANIMSDDTDHLIVCVSPSKAFNIAGLQMANIIVASDKIREKIDKALTENEISEVNPFGLVANMAAYNSGDGWMDALNQYLLENYKMLCQFFEQNLPMLKVNRQEGTYLAWIDCRALGLRSEELENRLLKQTGVWLNCGTMYGENGEGFMRINMACPKSKLSEGLQKIKQFVNLNYQK